MDCVVKQFPLKGIKSNQNKGWVTIPKSVRTKICNIANKIKDTSIRSFMPCIIAKTSAHLLSVHGDNKKTLVTSILCTWPLIAGLYFLCIVCMSRRNVFWSRESIQHFRPTFQVSIVLQASFWQWQSFVHSRGIHKDMLWGLHSIRTWRFDQNNH